MPRFTIKDLLIATMLIAIWCGAWYYMAHALFNYRHPDRHISLVPFLGCFIVACVTTNTLLRSFMLVKGPGVSVATFIGAFILNSIVFCIVASQA
jgi:hypothetical protein